MTSKSDCESIDRLKIGKDALSLACSPRVGAYFEIHSFRNYADVDTERATGAILTIPDVESQRLVAGIYLANERPPRDAVVGIGDFPRARTRNVTRRQPATLADVKENSISEIVYYREYYVSTDSLLHSFASFQVVKRGKLGYTNKEVSLAQKTPVLTTSI